MIRLDLKIPVNFMHFNTFRPYAAIAFSWCCKNSFFAFFKMLFMLMLPLVLLATVNSLSYLFEFFFCSLLILLLLLLAAVNSFSLLLLIYSSSARTDASMESSMLANSLPPFLSSSFS